MRKSLPILAVSALLLLVGCSNNNSSSAPATSTPLSPTTTTPTPSTPSSTSSSTPVPSTPLPVIDDYKKAILDLYKEASEGKNYTATYSSPQQTGVRRYTKNAFHSQPFSDDRENRINYASNDNGVFTYSLTDGVVESTSDYLLDADGNKYTSIYDIKVVDRWGDVVDQGEKYNPLLSINDLDFSEETLTGEDVSKNEFIIPNSFLKYVVPVGGVIPISTKFATCYVKLGDDQKSFILYDVSTSGNDYTYVISDIGSTTIPEVETFLENGGGPSIANTSPITPLFEAQNYVIYKGDDPVVYVNPNYSFNVISNTGYVYLSNNALENGAGVYNASYTNGAFALGEFAYSSELYDDENGVYAAIPSDILDSFEADGENKYKCEMMGTLYGLHLEAIFGLEEGTYASSATITANTTGDTVTSIDFTLAIGEGSETYTLKDFGTASLEGIAEFISSYSSSSL